MNALDLCAGAGGLSLGLQRAGWSVEAVEVDADACDTHRRHVGPCEQADVTTWHSARTFDLVAGGVPCQPFSYAGKSGSFSDGRGLLYRELLRVAEEACARVVLLENVRGLLSTRSDLGTAFMVVRREFAERGWIVRHAVLNAVHYGVPQNRKRLFLVGFRAEDDAARFRWPDATHDEPTAARLLGLARWGTVRSALALGEGRYEHGRLDGATGCVQSTTSPDLLDAPAATVLARDVGGNALGRKRFRAALLDAPAPTLTTRGYDEACDPRLPSRRPQAELARALVEAGLLDRPATTVQADPRVARAGHPIRQQRGAAILTADQRASLQGFPSGWTWTGNQRSQGRQIGNAVPPPLAEAVGRALLAALRVPEPPPPDPRATASPSSR